MDTIATRPAEPRNCTCHPDDNPPRPCTQKFAHSECVKAATRARDPYAIDVTKCAKCGSGEFHVQVLAWATFEDGTFVAFEYDEEVIPMRTIAICADCGTGRVIEP